MTRHQNGMKRLIVNADDFGWCRGITDGIIEAHRCGIVTSASLMVNRPASEYALSRAKEVPNLSVGIHLTLTEGAPVLPSNDVPSLVQRNRNFFSAEDATRKLLRGEFAEDEIEAEFGAQIEWLKSRGFIPTHADSHQHVHFYPVALRAFRRVMAREGILRTRAACSVYFPRDGRIGGAYAGSPLRRVLVQGYNNYLQRFVLRGFEKPDSSLTLHPSLRDDRDRLAEGWRVALANMESGTYELACHPGLWEDGFSSGDSLAAQREVELCLLKAQEYPAVLQDNAIRLISYVEL